MKTNKTKLKVGDKIICHTVCVVENKYNTTTIGKYYVITNINYNNYNRFCIIDDNGRDHYFYDSTSQKHSFYGKWFYPSLKRERREKLKRILKLNE